MYMDLWRTSIGNVHAKQWIQAMVGLETDIETDFHVDFSSPHSTYFSIQRDMRNERRCYLMMICYISQ